MSVEKVVNQQGQLISWKVRWKDFSNQRHSKNFPKGHKSLADQYDAEIKLAKKLKHILPSKAAEVDLASFAEEYMATYGIKKLSAAGYKTYKSVWDAYILGNRFEGVALGHHSLRSLEQYPSIIQNWVNAMEAHGVGPASVKKAVTVLSSVLNQGARKRYYLIRTNPCSHLNLLGYTPKQAKPLSPEAIERIRRSLFERRNNRRDEAQALKEAVFIGVLGYAGLRPGEALFLRFSDIEPAHIRVAGAISLGEEKDTKTGKQRRVPMHQALREDLEAYRQYRQAKPEELIFPATSGGYLSDSAWRDFRARAFKEAVKEMSSAPGLASYSGARPYDCRHGAASLWLGEGHQLAAVAKYLGHGVLTLQRHYQDFLDTQDPTPQPAAQAIGAARLKVWG